MQFPVLTIKRLHFIIKGLETEALKLRTEMQPSHEVHTLCGCNLQDAHCTDLGLPASILSLQWDSTTAVFVR